MTKNERNEPEAWEQQLRRLPLSQGGFSKELAERVQARVRMVPPVRGRSRKWLWLPAAALLGAVVFGVAEADRLKSAFTPLVTQPKDPALQPLDPNTALTLKVAYFSEEAFMSQYGAVFQKKFPNVKVEIIPYGDVSPVSSVMRSNPSTWPVEELPDVMGVNGAEFATLVRQGKLYALDEVVKKDGFPLKTAHPGLIEALRKQGDGKLYGLAPSFDQLAVYYNKALFDRYGVAYPEDGMSWEELLGIAAAIGEGGGRREGVYGLATGNGSWPTSMIMQVANAAGISIIDPKTRQVAIDTPQWRMVWATVLEALREGAVYEAPQSASGGNRAETGGTPDPFLTGKAAMTLQRYSYIQTLKASKNAPEWDVASEPVHPDRPSESMTFSLGGIFAVSANSPNRRAAWELIKLIQQEEPRRLEVDRYPESPAMPVASVPGKHTEAFLKVRPSDLLFDGSSSLGRTISGEVFKKLQTKSAEVLQGRKTLEQALRELQAEAEKLWNPEESERPGLVPLPKGNTGLEKNRQ
ncbi:extracellular solute-binding protein [Paenibacillus sp. tmac-D7]|uniref:extracellular solute-binding protein n=1 Tax=Paenibacillus sp. tmac-D7 TaxID=2591462 RepID=UPI001143F08B|nr:extracellular solute-binding protein [Paenibacillus sp. tmac-D7]